MTVPKRSEPNRFDPLSETSPGRRLWAASLKAGYETHASFARAIGIQQNTLYLVEADKTLLSLENFARACQLVGYSMEEIFFGRGPKTKEQSLTRDQIVRLCDELDVSHTERAALARHLESPEGALQRLTRSYVVAFVEVYGRAIRDKTPPELAQRSAIVAADNARADADAIAVGAKPSSRYKRRGPAKKRG
jgi:DNA-binding XRE family transcriptional regulator